MLEIISFFGSPKSAKIKHATDKEKQKKNVFLYGYRKWKKSFGSKK